MRHIAAERSEGGALLGMAGYARRGFRRLRSIATNVQFQTMIGAPRREGVRELSGRGAAIALGHASLGLGPLSFSSSRQRGGGGRAGRARPDGEPGYCRFPVRFARRSLGAAAWAPGSCRRKFSLAQRVALDLEIKGTARSSIIS